MHRPVRRRVNHEDCSPRLPRTESICSSNVPNLPGDLVDTLAEKESCDDIEPRIAVSLAPAHQKLCPGAAVLRISAGGA